MRLLRNLLLLSALVAGSTAKARADDVPAVECRPRGGLPNFLARAQAGAEVRLAYLGGSITAAGRCQRSAAAMEAVVDHYRIPSVHFGVEVARRLAAGTLTFKGPKPEPFDPAVDGGESRRVTRIDGYCTYWRLATLSVGDLSPGEHEIEITLADEQLDKRSILFEHNRADLASNPSKYAPHA